MGPVGGGAPRRRPRSAPAFVRATQPLRPRAGGVEHVTLVLGLEFAADPMAVRPRRDASFRGPRCDWSSPARRRGLLTRWRLLKRRFVDSVWPCWATRFFTVHEARQFANPKRRAEGQRVRTQDGVE